MEKFFLNIINSSITASWLVLALLLLRPFLKKAPKALSVALWGFVGLRVLFPVSIESVFSLIPSAQTVPQEILTSHSPVIHSGISFVNSAINPVISQALAPTQTASPVVTLTRIGLWVWLGGLCLMLVYSAVSYALLRRQVRIHLPLQKQVYVCDSISNPFILGIFRPRIYLPSHLSSQQVSFVLAHEFAHLQRKDHWWKPLGFLLLSIHWFNPLMWVAYILLCRDIELACDEKVIRSMETAEKKGYSEALVACSLQRHLVFACPLAFGEVAVKDRIKSVFHYKKPALWIILAAVLISIALCVGFLTDPVSAGKVDSELSDFLYAQVHQHNMPKGENIYFAADIEILGSEKQKDEITVYMWVLYSQYQYTTHLEDTGGGHIITAITAKKTDEGYKLTEYWEPRDGSFYVKDIKAKVPLRFRQDALDGQRFIQKQQERLDAKAAQFTSLQAVTGIYEYPDSPDPLPPTLQLQDGQRFHFRYSAYSSYYAYGTYEIKDSKLILSTEDGLYTYVFDIGNGGFIFDAESSSYIPEYRYSSSAQKTESPVPDGAVFKKSERLTPVVTTPPSMYVFCGDRGVEAWTGTYSWEITLSDGTKRGTNADSSHPMADLDSVPILPLMPTAISAIEPYQAQLTFAQQPKSVNITRYPILSDPTGAVEQSPVECSSGGFSLAYGRYLYEIVATFDSPDGSGTVHYAFSTSTPAIGYITMDDFGLTMDATMGDNNMLTVTFTHDASKATMTGQLHTGDMFGLEIKHNGKWLFIADYLQNVLKQDFNPEDIFYNPIARLIKQNGTTTMTHDLSVFGELPAGTYRLSKTVTLTAPDGTIKSAIYNTAEFAIVD